MAFVVDATEEQKGVVELATGTEMSSGRDNVVPDAATVKNYIDAQFRNPGPTFLWSEILDEAGGEKVVSSSANAAYLLETTNVITSNQAGKVIVYVSISFKEALPDNINCTIQYGRGPVGNETWTDINDTPERSTANPILFGVEHDAQENDKFRIGITNNTGESITLIAKGDPLESTYLQVFGAGSNAQSAALPDDVTQAEAEAGSLSDNRSWSPLRVAQAIVALGGGSAAVDAIRTSLNQVRSLFQFSSGDLNQEEIIQTSAPRSSAYTTSDLAGLSFSNYVNLTAGTQNLCVRIEDAYVNQNLYQDIFLRKGTGGSEISRLNTGSQLRRSGGYTYRNIEVTLTAAVTQVGWFRENPSNISNNLSIRASDITSGILDDARIPSSIARDSEIPPAQVPADWDATTGPSRILNKPAEATQAEAEAGTETGNRSWSPLRVAQAIAALASTVSTFAWTAITGRPSIVPQAEAEAGTATTERIWTAERVKQAITALGTNITSSTATWFVNGLMSYIDKRNVDALTGLFESTLVSSVDWGEAGSVDISLSTTTKATRFIQSELNGPPSIQFSSLVHSYSGSITGQRYIIVRVSTNIIEYQRRRGYRVRFGGNTYAFGGSITDRVDSIHAQDGYEYWNVRIDFGSADTQPKEVDIVTRSTVDVSPALRISLDRTQGTLPDNQVPNLNANKITTGTLDDARIPYLNANKITTGTLDDARIPSSIARDSEIEVLKARILTQKEYLVIKNTLSSTDRTIYWTGNN